MMHDDTSDCTTMHHVHGYCYKNVRLTMLLLFDRTSIVEFQSFRNIASYVEQVHTRLMFCLNCLYEIGTHPAFQRYDRLQIRYFYVVENIVIEIVDRYARSIP